jgi:hypothetical protein
VYHIFGLSVDERLPRDLSSIGTFYMVHGDPQLIVALLGHRRRLRENAIGKSSDVGFFAARDHHVQAIWRLRTLLLKYDQDASRAKITSVP